MSEDDLEVMETVVPRVFFKLADYYHQKPEVLAALLVIDFCQHPPKNLVIIEQGGGEPPGLRTSAR